MPWKPPGTMSVPHGGWSQQSCPLQSLYIPCDSMRQPPPPLPHTHIFPSHHQYSKAPSCHDWLAHARPNKMKQPGLQYSSHLWPDEVNTPILLPSCVVSHAPVRHVVCSWICVALSSHYLAIGSDRSCRVALGSLISFCDCDFVTVHCHTRAGLSDALGFRLRLCLGFRSCTRSFAIFRLTDLVAIQVLPCSWLKSPGSGCCTQGTTRGTRIGI